MTKLSSTNDPNASNQFQVTGYRFQVKFNLQHGTCNLEQENIACVLDYFNAFYFFLRMSTILDCDLWDYHDDHDQYRVNVVKQWFRRFNDYS